MHLKQGLFLFALTLLAAAALRTAVPVSADHSNQLQLDVVSNTGDPEVVFDVDPPGTCDSENVAVTSSGAAGIVSCGDQGLWLVGVNTPGGWLVESTTCQLDPAEDGAIPGQDSGLSGQGELPLQLTILDNEHVLCTFVVAEQAPPQQLFVTADPNVLSCGGTSEITAVLPSATGEPIEGKDFVFTIESEYRGLIEKTSSDTAELTLDPGTPTTSVTARTAHNGEILEGSVIVQNDCNTKSGDVAATVAVTANPNVISCDGSSVITATARDESGHIVEGVGYHFSVAQGQGLLLPPPDATHIENVAVFTMVAGQNTAENGYGEAVIRVSVNEVLFGEVRVQQFCPGATTNATTAPGPITLNAASTNLVCGEQTFIGARVRDSKMQVVPDGTQVNFLTTAGSIVASGGTPPEGGLNPAGTTASTTNGVLNMVYTAGAVEGPVKITAAAGDSYGEIIVNVSCSGTSAPPPAGAARCIPVGGSVCITPPSTGNGGLRR